jgi:hypothetical protein
VALAAAEAQYAAQLSELQADLSRLRSSTQRSSYLAEDPEVGTIVNTILYQSHLPAVRSPSY